jgi:phosphoserine aminotransferase
VKSISFYPGPSRIQSEVPSYLAEAYESGILGMNHRSQPFMSMLEENDHILKEKLKIPESYRIYYVSSATECWEIIAQSITKQLGSLHISNGAFGKKWYRYTRALTSSANILDYDPQDQLPISQIIPLKNAVICLTQNETSNGSRIDPSQIAQIKDQYPENLIAVDATSSMAGISLDFNMADIWFASVQKCFGLPSGMALLICSPKTLDICEDIGEKDHYNSLLFIEENMQLWQTTHTPNILDIFLLNKVMSARKGINKVDKKLSKRAAQWTEFFEKATNLRFYIENVELRSKTILALEGDPDFITKLRNQASEAGLILGTGYGDLKETTIRIANFPAIKKKEIKYLRDFLIPII